MVRVERVLATATIARTVPDPRGLSEQVERWSGRVRRSYAGVVLRRYIALALALAIVIEAAARIATAASRPLWALAGVAVALLGAVVAVATPIRRERVAGLLDHGLGLVDRARTALELESTTGVSPVLASHVTAEAQEALRSSFGSARARPRPAGGEWGAAATLALLLVLLLVLPAGHRHHGAAGRSLTARGSSPAAAGRTGAAARRAHARRPAPLPVGAGVNTILQPPLAIGPSTSETGKGLGTSPYGHGAVSTGSYVTSKTGLSQATAGTRIIAAPGAGGGSPNADASGGSAHGAGSAGARASAYGGSGGLGAPGSAPGSAPGAVRPGGHGGGTPGRAGGAADGGSQSGRSSSQAAPPGGEKAGASPGSTQLEAGLAPQLAQGATGLPLQAGYAPTAAREAGHGAISQTPNGGGGKARAATGGGTGSGGAASAAAAIEPTPNTDAPAAQSLVSGYFGVANELQPGSW